MFIVAPLSSALPLNDPKVRQNVVQGGGYQKDQGTSMASPHIAGVTALMLQVNPNLTPSQVNQALQQTARKDAYTGSTPNNLWGAGKVDALAAAQAITPVTTTDFGLTASSPLSVLVGGQTSGTITSTVSGGFSASISLSASGLPAGATASFSPQAVAVPGAGTSTMTIVTSSSTPAGTSTITITGSGGGKTHMASTQLVVSPVGGGNCTSEVEPNDFSSQATPLAVPGCGSGSAGTGDNATVFVTFGDGTREKVPDLWSVTVGQPGTLTLNLIGETSGTDLDLFLYRFEGNSLNLLATSAGSTASESLTYPIASGTYYVGIGAARGSTRYTISSSLTGGGGGGGPTIKLAGGHVEISVSYVDPYSGQRGSATPLPENDSFAFFYYTDPQNPEVFVKALDFGTEYKIFFGGLTDFGLTVTFKNVSTGQTVTLVKDAKTFNGGGGSLPK